MGEKSALKTDVLVLLGLRRKKSDKDWGGPSYLLMAKKRRHLVAVTSQLEALVRCNSPLVYGLQMAAIDAPNANVASVLLGLRDDMAAGSRLWESMARLNNFFPRYYVDLVKVGEETGSLERTFADLCDLQIQALDFWDGSKAWIYFYLPLLCLSNLLVLLFLATYIFPEFATMMRDFGGELPPLAQWLSSWVPNLFFDAAPTPLGPFAGAAGSGTTQGTSLVSIFFWLLPVFFVVFGLLVCVVALNREAVARFLSPIGIYIPGLRRLIMYANLGHMAIVLDRMLSAGIPLDQALASAAQLDLNPVFARKLERLRTRILQGETLSDAVVAERGFPDSFSALVSVGERSGLLEESLRKLGAHYSRQTTKAVRLLADTVGPVCVLLVGILVLAVNVTAFSMLTSLSQSLIDSM